ncbi:hypothetical protein CR970_01885 [Candidatus Saccharibacteria bacterium]|nr:MAG: hypothetical protein CR970_01885 [Candidatus Saccharibacteria bacterium]
MGTTNSANKTSPEKLLAYLQMQAPDLLFQADTSFYWSAKNQTVHYDPQRLTTDAGRWALLHETAHGQLQHANYDSDFDLLQLEIDAWEAAQQLAAKLDIRIDQNHIEDCLDTYRDWLHHRSTCPTCGTVSLQQSATTYHCHNCQATWRVSASRFCRPYRRLRQH